jgi:hypothetical protein
MPKPKFNHFLPPHCHGEPGNTGTRFALPLGSCNGSAESDMDLKIYLLIMLIGTLLAAIHFTSASEQRSERLPQ